MAHALSAHLIDSYYATLQEQQTIAATPTPLVISGAMSFNPQMHGSSSRPSAPTFGAVPSASMSAMVVDAPAPAFEAPYYMPDISEATARKIATLQAKLNQRLGPEYISQRPGPGGGPKLTYAEGWKIINLANEVFGFNGWCSNVVSLTTDFVDFSEESRRYTVGVTAIVKVTLRDGVFHEDIGYGMLENSKSKGAAIDKCKKEAVTDGLKRALRNFGNLLGNCLYDKSYTQEVTKMKVPTVKFDENQLHRRPEFEKPRPQAGPIASTSTANAGPGSSSAQRLSALLETPTRPPLAQTTNQPPKSMTSIPAHILSEMEESMASAMAASTTNQPNTVGPTTPQTTKSTSTSVVAAGKQPAGLPTGLQTPVTPAIRPNAGQQARPPPLQQQQQQQRRPSPPAALQPQPQPQRPIPGAGFASSSASTSKPASAPAPQKPHPPAPSAALRAPQPSTSTPAAERKVTFLTDPAPDADDDQDDHDRRAADMGSEDSFCMFSDDEALLATIDLGEGDLGRPIDFEEGMVSVAGSFDQLDVEGGGSIPGVEIPGLHGGDGGGSIGSAESLEYVGVFDEVTLAEALDESMAMLEEEEKKRKVPQRQHQQQRDQDVTMEETQGQEPPPEQQQVRLQQHLHRQGQQQQQQQRQFQRSTSKSGVSNLISKLPAHVQRPQQGTHRIGLNRSGSTAGATSTTTTTGVDAGAQDGASKLGGFNFPPGMNIAQLRQQQAARPPSVPGAASSSGNTTAATGVKRNADAMLSSDRPSHGGHHLGIRRPAGFGMGLQQPQAPPAGANAGTGGEDSGDGNIKRLRR